MPTPLRNEQERPLRGAFILHPVSNPLLVALVLPQSPAPPFAFDMVTLSTFSLFAPHLEPLQGNPLQALLPLEEHTPS